MCVHVIRCPPLCVVPPYLLEHILHSLIHIHMGQETILRDFPFWSESYEEDTFPQLTYLYPLQGCCHPGMSEKILASYFHTPGRILCPC